MKTKLIIISAIFIAANIAINLVSAEKKISNLMEVRLIDIIRILSAYGFKGGGILLLFFFGFIGYPLLGFGDAVYKAPSA